MFLMPNESVVFTLTHGAKNTTNTQSPSKKTVQSLLHVGFVTDLFVFPSGFCHDEITSTQTHKRKMKTHPLYQKKKVGHPVVHVPFLTVVGLMP